jgi:hypothetical protein
MSAPRPNELSGEVAPNTLSGTGGGARQPTPPVATGMPTGPQTPAPVAGPRRARRPFSVWTLVVIGFLVFNVVRGFLAGAGSGTTPVQTTAPRATATAAGGEPSTDPNVTAGLVDFATEAESDCSVANPATVFPPGTQVWWEAHLGTFMAGDASVVTKLIHDGEVLERATGPDADSSEPWNILCASEPIRYFGLGTYRFEVWDAAERVLLAVGEFELAG